MKRLLGFALVAAVLVTPAFAGIKGFAGIGSHNPTVTIPENVQVGSTKVPAGDYKIAWTGSGSDVQVTLSQKDKVVATFSAKTAGGSNSPNVQTEKKGDVLFLNTITLKAVSLVVEDTPHTGQQ